MSFELLRAALEKSTFHVSPFLVLGDPNPHLSVRLARAAVEAGAGMLEIGFPYSDPVADGVAIQQADLRALEGGTSTRRAIISSCSSTSIGILNRMAYPLDTTSRAVGC